MNVSRTAGIWRHRSKELPQRLRYFLWALRGLTAVAACPCCEGTTARTVDTKLGVTRLRECLQCGLRYRTPTDTAALNERFYQDEYQDGFSGRLPSDEDLARMLGQTADPNRALENWQTRHRDYVALMNAAGLKAGHKILDYGCSWGWGGHVLRSAGFEVTGYEISAPRANFARMRMKLDVLSKADERPNYFDGILASHVLEHLPDPNVLWQIASTSLKPGGLLVILVPNGNEACRAAFGPERYSSTWGQVHPLMVTSASLRNMAGRHGFSAQLISEPYDLPSVSSAVDGDQSGLELCCVARKMS